jgi:hypothetical protein
MGVWDVLAEGDREHWIYSPSLGAGPLRFGMSPDEAVAALDGFTGIVHGPTPDANHRAGTFRREANLTYKTAVSVYFGEAEGLFCVIPDARFGPQVTIDGIRLVGRVPSQCEADLLSYLSSRGIAPQYAPGGDPGADELGLIMGVQRAGDIVVTRPALLIERECAFTLWDALPVGEGAIR